MTNSTVRTYITAPGNLWVQLHKARRRLLELREQKAKHGPTPPTILLHELEEAERWAKALEEKLDALPEAELEYLRRVSARQELLPTSKLFVTLSGIAAEGQFSQLLDPSQLLEYWKGRVEPEFVVLRMEQIGKQQRIVRVPLPNVLEAIQRYKSFVLLGIPGSGKTTCLERLAWQRAEAKIANFKDNPFPLHADLGDLPSHNSVLDWLVYTLEKRWSAPLLAEHIEWYLENGLMLFLLDGFNEIAAVSRFTWIKRLQTFMKQYSTNSFVISCRTLDYESEFDLPRVEILPLSEARIRQFLELYLGDKEADKLIGQLETRGIRKLGNNPYFLTLLAFIYISEEKLPTRRGLLLQTFIHALYKKDEERFSEIRILPSSVHQRAIGWLAFEAHKLVGSGAPISMQWVGQNMPKEMVIKGVTWRLDPQIVVKQGSDTNLIDIRVDWKSIRFTHQILQEYFAGTTLLQRLQLGQEVETQEYWRIPILRQEMPRVKFATNWREPLPPPPPTGWEEATILAVGCEDVADAILLRMLDDNPLLTARCLTEGFANVSKQFRTKVIDTLLKLISNRNVSLRTRIVAGDLLGELGDPRLDQDHMVWIPGGEFLMGDDGTDVFGNTTPCHTVEVQGFWISKYPVTYSEFGRFIDQKGYNKAGLWTEAGWKWRQNYRRTQPDFWEDPAFHRLNCPVVGISWYEAVAYAEWAGKRLPTEAEWEKVASWDPKREAKRKYPWGNRFDARRVNVNHGFEIAGRITPVGIYPAGESAYGVFDLIGNVWEWCSSLYRSYRYNPGDGREDLEASGNRVLRGGTFWSSREFAFPTTRFRHYPGYRFDVGGFRLASDDDPPASIKSKELDK